MFLTCDYEYLSNCHSRECERSIQGQVQVRLDRDLLFVRQTYYTHMDGVSCLRWLHLITSLARSLSRRHVY